jgi:hypothetical protein
MLKIAITGASGSVGDNATRFWDLEPGRALFGFWPLDGVRDGRVVRG